MMDNQDQISLLDVCTWISRLYESHAELLTAAKAIHGTSIQAANPETIKVLDLIHAAIAKAEEQFP